ncbi:unnamed protein product [Caenorhabditis auriculariae]|uniref:G-protein coupled receptors family 1 profile domain-containing protein n=1 Tax=Caenorhabditis auriculariae TaxID=2777116 RepID=A0A8S1HTH0_9PELO|nr:unnamed protein product [Caenorhabditis auriculariae]
MLEFRHYASIVMFLVSIFGTVSNCLAILVVLKNSALKSSFGALCFSHCVANLGVLVIFGFFAAPLNFLLNNFENINSSFANQRMGQISLMFYNASIVSHLFVSINRFVFIIFPTKAVQLMGRQTTGWIIVFIWVLSIVSVSPLSSETCNFTFTPPSLQWGYSDTYCGQTYAQYGDFYFGITVVGLVALFDMITLTKLRRANEVWQSKNLQATTTKTINVRRSNELRLFAQALIQGCLLLIVLCSFNIFSGFSDTALSLFITTTLVCQIFHASDG